MPSAANGWLKSVTTVTFKEIAVLPRTLYELLPFIYSPTGLAAIANLDTPLGRLSGAMLLSASVAIYTMRRLYRSK